MVVIDTNNRSYSALEDIERFVFYKCDVELVSYGLGHSYEQGKFEEIINDCSKPKGGLWSSPVNSSDSWFNWCIKEGYKNKLNSNFQWSLSGHILFLDTLDCFKLLPVTREGDVDFELLLSLGVDAIWLTADGLKQALNSDERRLWGWDCETVLLLNKCVARGGV
jgi:hypothetical protein